MLEGVTIEQLRTLSAVADAGNFSAAARRLGRVQAAVSQAIDRLEAQLGLRLFDRSGRVPRLTHAGEAVLAAARRVEGEVAALEEVVARLKQGIETRLAIAVDAMFPAEALVAFARAFAAAHPTVELVLLTEVLSAVTAEVRDRHARWGVAIEDADLSELDRRPIAEVRLVPVAAPSHPLAAAGRPIASADLAGAVQMVLSEHDHSSGDRGVFSPRTWRVADLATKHALIAAGLGWGHMPEHLIRDDLAGGRLVELKLEAWGEAPPKRALVLVWRTDAVMGPVAKWAEERLSSLCLQALGADHQSA